MTTDRTKALGELRDLVATYLEGSDDAARAAELISSLEVPSQPQALGTPTARNVAVEPIRREEIRREDVDYDRIDVRVPSPYPALSEALGMPVVDIRPTFLPMPTQEDRERVMQENRERAMFGCTVTAIDEVLAGKSARDVAIYAMDTLSNAQELIRREDVDFDRIDVRGGTTVWTVANTIRQLINIAKYAIDKAVPRDVRSTAQTEKRA